MSGLQREQDFWALFRFADVKAASRDWQSFTSPSGSFLEKELEAMREFMPPEGKFQDLDPPRCTELRRIVPDPFLPRAVAARENDIRAIVVELIESFAQRVGTYSAIVDRTNVVEESDETNNTASRSNTCP